MFNMVEISASQAPSILRQPFPSQPNMPSSTVHGLQCKMANMTADRFKAWRLYIRKNGQPFLDVPPNNLNQLSKWNMFEQAVLKQFPELGAYDGLWPIEKYFTLHRSHERTRRKCVSRRSSSASVTQALPDVAQPVSTPKRARVFVGKPPPRHRASSRVCFDQNSASYHVQVPNPCPSLSSVTQVMMVDHAPVSPSLPLVSDGHSRQSCPATSYPVACLWCDHRPAVPQDCAREIRAISQNNDSMISALAVLGVVSDHHMRLFSEWGTVPFLSSIPLSMLGLLYRTVLSKYLSKANQQHQSEDRPRPVPDSDPVQYILPPFQQPPTDLERRIINAPLSALREAMGLENDIEGFERVVATINNCLNDLATTDACEGKTLVNKICSKCPSLKNYQNSWPITTYIKWRRQELCSQRLSGKSKDLNDTAEITDARNGQQEQNAQGSDSPVALPFTGCGMHPLPNVAEACPKLRELLHSFGMQELLAIFLAVGIRSDEDFNLFCALDFGEKRDMFKDLAHYDIKLNPFQEMMLGRMLEHLCV